MGMPLSMLSTVMTTEEFEHHHAAYRLSPWGPHRDNLHAALIAREVANMSGRTLEEGAMRALDDYLLHAPNADEDDSAEDDSEIDNFQD